MPDCPVPDSAKRTVKQPGARLTLVLACVLMALAGACAPRTPPAAQPSSPRPGASSPDHGDHDPASHGAHAGHELRATAGPGHTVADVRFMQMMIGHHEQALRMTMLAAGRTENVQVLQLVEKIDISQHDELAQMRTWLARRGQGVPGAGHAHDMSMPGMVTDRQFAELAEARGSAFDRLFLQLMIHHHAGALEMVDELFATPGAGQDPDIFRFATDVAADQADEIGVMQILLNQLPVEGDR